MSLLRRIVHEIHRRSIWQVLLIYLGASWVVLQVIDQFQDNLGLPSWVYGAALVLLLIGLPIVLATAFVQEGPAPPASEEAPLPHRVLTWRNAIGGGLLAFVVGGAVLVAWLNFTPNDTADADADASIAVLPFVDMSAARDQEYFGDGITEEILNVLASVPGLRVPARTSSFSFKGKNLPIRDIAQQLKVAHVLEGSVRKSGDRVRITAQLIDAKSDQHLWSETYDRSLSDVFAVQDEIAHAIVDALKLQMKQPQSTLVAKETENGRAHELYLEGLYYWNMRHASEMRRTLELFRKATREDPNYARAWAGVALTYALLPQYIDFDRDLAVREGKAAAQRALQLDPKAADAQAALGQIASELEWDWTSAGTHLDRAVAMDPNYATARQWRTELYMILGRYDEALAEVQHALQLDPLSMIIRHVHGFVLYLAGRPHEAEPIYRSILAQDPDFTMTFGNFAMASWQVKQYDQALELNDASLAKVTRGLQKPSQRPAALRTLADSSFRARHWHGLVATAYLEFGLPDSAAAILNRSVDRWRSSMTYFARSPVMNSIAQHPQFLEYRRKVRL